MDKTTYLPRLIDSKVDSYLSAFGAISLEGPKYSGKTMTGLKHSKSSFFVSDPSNNFTNRRIATISQDIPLQGDTPRLIDEWQEVPGLWDAVRFTCDTRQAKGQFILTGSAGVSPSAISHSGAGRIARLKMNTMSLFESGDSSGKVSLRGLLNKEYPNLMTGEIKLQELACQIIKGGWPGNIGADVKAAKLLPKEYINSILEYDIYKLDGKRRDKHRMQLLMRSLARNESTTAGISTIKKDIAGNDGINIDDETISEYLSILDRLYLIENQKPFGMGIRSSTRVKQAEKRHFTDPSLAAALLNLNEESLISDLETFEFLFEALVERDLRIYAEANDAVLLHYQDYKNREIDAVVEFPDGSWAGFEIKLGADQIDKAAENLLKIQKEILADPKGKAPAFLAVISGLSNAAYMRPDGIYVLPITALRD